MPQESWWKSLPATINFTDRVTFGGKKGPNKVSTEPGDAPVQAFGAAAKQISSVRVESL